MPCSLVRQNAFWEIFTICRGTVMSHPRISELGDQCPSMQHSPAISHYFCTFLKSVAAELLHVKGHIPGPAKLALAHQHQKSCTDSRSDTHSESWNIELLLRGTFLSQKKSIVQAMSGPTDCNGMIMLCHNEFSISEVTVGCEGRHIQVAHPGHESITLRLLLLCCLDQLC